MLLPQRFYSLNKDREFVSHLDEMSSLHKINTTVRSRFFKC